MVCHRFSFVVLGLVLGSFAWVNAQDELPSPLEVQRQRRQAAGATEPTAQDAQKIANAKLLFDELKNLTPGGLPEGSDIEKEMRKVVDQFLDQNFEEAESILDAAKANNEVLPPKELLLAGLWFAVKNGQRGNAYLDKSAVDNPEYPAIFTAFARLAISQNRLTDALALLEKSERLYASQKFSEVESQHFRKIYLDTIIDLKILRKKYAEARNYVDQLQALTPDTPKVLLAYAELAFYDKDIPSSIEYLKRYKEEVPGALLPELTLANWFQRTGDRDKFEEYVKKASSMYPDDLTTQIRFAEYAISREDFRSAQVALDKVEKAKGETGLTLSLKAKIAFAKQAYGLAETHYGKLARMAPRDFDLRNMYALSLAESDDEEKRKQALQIAGANFQQVQNNPVAIAAFGWVAFKNGKTTEADQLLRRAAQAPKLAPEIAYYLATLLHSQGNSQQAKLILEPALKEEGFFLYRAAANELMKSINESELPSPKK